MNDVQLNERSHWARFSNLARLKRALAQIIPGFHHHLGWNREGSRALGEPARTWYLRRFAGQHLHRALASKDVIDALVNQGVEPGYGSPADLDAFINSDAAMWSKLVKESGIKPE